MSYVRRRQILIAAGVLLVHPLAAEAQQFVRTPRIGFLSASGDPSTPGLQVEAFRQGLQHAGYVEGKNILVEYRYAEGKLDRMPSLVAELVRLKPDILVVAAIPAIRAAKDATNSIPIVMVTTVDPVAAGFVESLARPGGNITGSTYFTRHLSGKRLELLAEVLPGISRVGVLWDGDGPGPKIAFREYQAAARAMSIKLESLEVRGPTPDIDGAFRAATNARAGALVTILNPLLLRYQKAIAEQALKSRLPSMCEDSQFVRSGLLMSYAANYAEQWQRAAVYVDKILKGAKPGDLPVEQPSKFELVVNMRTAKTLGLKIPQSVLLRADELLQ